jgi:hypothetical protein
LFKNKSNVGFAFGFLTHDFDPAFATVFEKPLFTSWSLLDNIEGFFVGHVFESLDFIDDFGLEFLREVLESLRDELDVGVGQFEERTEFLYRWFLKQVVLKELAGSADQFIMGFVVVNGFEDLFFLDPVDKLFFRLDEHVFGVLHECGQDGNGLEFSVQEV